ncbi:MAG TPA: phosphoribosylanthranilate isomerase [Gemmataceae bacterium]|jgi:phosphoribosylanthranilate isomerase|nr:phosphoribosylanthranilate isomerase [Gemmataceae bacterium]
MNKGFVKICGVTGPQDAEAAVEFGADFVGVNFYPGSPRFVTPELVPAILSVLAGKAEAVAVAVMVKPVREQFVNEATALQGFGIIQWHDTDHEPRPWLTKPLIPAFAVQGAFDLARIKEYVELCRRENCLPRALLIDAFARGLHGGTGKTAPWNLLAGFDPGVPIILAGGLKPENVGEAIRTVRPFGVDVASGVETEPGRKDHDKMRRFIEAAREAFGL